MSGACSPRERRLWFGLACLSVVQCFTLVLVFTGQRAPLATSGSPIVSDFEAPARRRLLESLSDALKIEDGQLVINVPLKVASNMTVGEVGDAATRFTVNAGLRVVGTTSLNSLRVHYTTQLGQSWKGENFPLENTHLPDVPLAVWGEQGILVLDTAAPGNAATQIQAGEVRVYSDSAETTYEDFPAEDSKWTVLSA